MAAAQTHPTTPPKKAGKEPIEKLGVLLLLIVSSSMLILNETTLSVGLPAIMADYGIPATTAQWLVTGFMLAMAIVIPATGFLIERFDTKKLYLSAMAFFLVGSIISALAPAFALLLVGRVLQAIGTATMLPLMVTSVFMIVPPSRRGEIMGVVAIVMSVAPALGPTVAGLILSIGTWHWLFWTMVPIAAVLIIIGTVKMQNLSKNRALPLDFLSVVLSVVAFAGLVYGLSSMSSLIIDGESMPVIIFLVGIVFLGLFVYRQLMLGRRGKALLDMKPFAFRNFTISLAIIILSFVGFLGMVNVFPIYLQGSLLVSALATGLMVLPGGLLQGVVSPIAGRFFDNVGPRPIVIPGAVIMLVSVIWFYFTASSNLSPALFIGILAVFNVGMGMVLTAMMTTSLSSIPSDVYSHGSAIINTLQQLGGAAGTAIMVTALTITSNHSLAAGATEPTALGDGMKSGYLVAIILLAVVTALSLFVHDPDKNRGKTVIVNETQPTARKSVTPHQTKSIDVAGLGTKPADAAEAAAAAATADARSETR